MSDTNTEKTVHGMMAEFTSVDSLLSACRRIREAGYTKTDAYTPFPVHGIEKALGIKPTRLPWIALGGGIAGAAIAMLMQVWMNGIDYKYIISGKPFISLPAFIPVAFELTILLASFGAFFGMWALNGLPRFSNPMFTDPRFDRATDDRFFLYIDSRDERYDAEGVRNLLADTGSDYINEVVEDETPKQVPRPIYIVWALLVAASMVPLLIILTMRVTNSPDPRFHVFLDMDFSPSKDAQQTTSLFADNRAMRPDVPGTVSRGQMPASLDVLTGIDVDALARSDQDRVDRLVRAYVLDDQQAQEQEKEATEQEDAQAKQDAATDGQDEVAEQQEAAKEKGGDAAETPEAKDTEAKDTEQSGTEQSPTEREEMPQGAAASEGETPAGEPQAAAGEAAEASGEPSVMDTTPWLKRNPMDIDLALLQRGRTQFGIYCSVCHGMDGRGNGLVNQRAQSRGFDTWVPPASLHQDTLYADAYPDGKLFSTISNGIRKMPGYASQITVEDRWAIVAYVRALQASQNASLEAVPAERRGEVEQAVAEAQAELERQAEEAREAAEQRQQDQT